MELVLELVRRARSYIRLAARATNRMRRSELLELAACCLDGAAQGARRLKDRGGTGGGDGPIAHSGPRPR